MKIHYTATVWHGGFYKFFGRALASLGHKVRFFDDRGTKTQLRVKKIFSRIPKFQYAVNSRFRNAVSRDWLASVQAFRPDLLILEHAPNILPDYLAKARELRQPIFYWLDSPPAGSQAQDILASLKFADRIFSVDRKWMTILYDASDFIHLPLAGDPDTFRPLGIKEKDKKYDVVFLGSFPPQSGDGYLRADIVANIPEHYSVAAFGNGAGYWTKYFPILRERVRESGILSDAAVNEIYNQSRIVLNIHSTWHASSLSGRTYEIALTGAFQIVDYREDLDVLLPENFIPVFRAAREVNHLLEQWLERPEERLAIAAGTRKFVLEHHTWRQRAEEMLKHL